MWGRCKEEVGVKIRAGSYRTGNSVRLEVGVGHGVEFSPHMYTCEFSCSTQPTHAHWLASVERDGHEEIKPRQLPEEAMDVGKVTLI